MPWCGCDVRCSVLGVRMFLDRGRHISDMLVSLLAGTCRFSTLVLLRVHSMTTPPGFVSFNYTGTSIEHQYYGAIRTYGH